MQDEESTNKDAQNITGTVLYVAIDGNYAGCISLSDTINNGSIFAIQELKNSA